jgi:hypothetical protein
MIFVEQSKMTEITLCPGGSLTIIFSGDQQPYRGGMSPISKSSPTDTLATSGNKAEP